MLLRFQQYIAENRLASTNSKILLAVSGGVDSMVMTHLFIKAGFSVAIAHCNFALRGAEADRDQQMVANFADCHNIPFYTIKFDTLGYARSRKLSIEMAARELRYNWFEKISLEEGFDYVAVAHNMNDNAETVLLNMARGTGLTGLTGIKSRNGKIIRPLLFALREEIEAYAHKNGISFCTDSTNNETLYSRNKIRHQVIPILNSINSAAVSNIAVMSQRLTEIDTLLLSMVEEIRLKLKENTYNSSDEKYNIVRLKQFANNRTIIYELFKKYGITNAHIEQLLALLGGRAGRQMTTSTHRLLCDREELIVSSLNGREEALFMLFHNIESINNSTLLDAQVVNVDSNFTIPQSSNIACFDYDKIKFPLTLRNWREGDYFVPLGMKGRKKVSDFLIDQKIALSDKERVLVLLSGEKIIWIVGYRIADSSKIESSTAQSLLISTKTSFPS